MFQTSQTTVLKSNPTQIEMSVTGFFFLIYFDLW